MTESTSEPAPESAAPVRWGILATGRIAHSFAADLMLVPDAQLTAVGSRRVERAREFAAAYDHYGLARAHGSYEELVADPDVDVVYVASPHSHHLEHARLALEAGKHVLCEKALTLNATEAEELVGVAKANDRFLMEAMWTACHPVIRALQSELADGRFGTPRQLHAELGFVVTPEDPDRLFDASLGASVLLDMGIYPLTFAHLLFGEAEALTAQADVRTTDAGSFDTDLVMTGRYARGVLATLACSMSSWSSRAAAIGTDRGRIDLADFHHPAKAVFTEYAAGTHGTPSGRVVEIVGDEPVVGKGYGNEILEVNRCLREELLESPLVPLSQTLTLMRQMDWIRETVGARFARET
ncbi:Gfo/Idh/MocA family oxidoreductase [Nocardioides sp. KR10-350]|uniref:Gfo/Idh/MocA family protein n=1 Tax=Nocardioides cheoyonin TaxID=3156615 RepID=UPI0032B5A11F